jgi:hypothetical protein
MHKSGRTLPSAHEIADHPATRDSLLKPGAICQPESRHCWLTDLFEKSLYRFEPAACPGIMPIAAGTNRFLEFSQ